MEIKWIEDFIALAQYQSFSRAAEIRNVTQSGLSRRIQALERWVGAELIDRSAYPPTLTSAGKLFREAADDMLGKLFDTRAIIRSEQRMAGAALQLAAGHAMAVGFVPGWLRTLAQGFDALRMRIVPTNVHDSVLMLVNGACELMLAYEHPELPLHLDPARYPHLTVGHDVLLPVSVPNRRGAPLYRLPGTAAQPLPMLGYSGSTFLGRCLSLLLERAETKPVLNRQFESDMADVLKQLALNGEGVAWLPQSLVAAELAERRLVPAGGASWQLTLELRLYRDRNNDMPRLKALWAYLEAQR